MKKLFFVLCMISAFGVSSMAQIVINPPSDPPVNNVGRWMRLDEFFYCDAVPHFRLNDFLGGYDVSLLIPSQEKISFFSLDLNTTPIEDLTVSIDYNIDGSLHSSQFDGTGSMYADWRNVDTYVGATINTLYIENASDKSGSGSVTMTSDCIPTSSTSCIEVLVAAGIEWDNGNYSALFIMYDFTLNGFSYYQ